LPVQFEEKTETKKISFNKFLHKLVFVDFLFGSYINNFFIKNKRFPYYFTDEDFYGVELGNSHIFTLWNFHYTKCKEFFEDKKDD
jgi:hypothetical protein